MVVTFLSYMGGNTGKLNFSSVEIPENISEENVNLYILLKKSIDLFSDFLKSNNIDLYEELGVSRSCEDILVEFVEREIRDDKGIAMSFMNTLNELVKREVLYERYDRVFSESDTRAIYLIANEVWIQHKILSECIVPEMLTRLKSRQVLGCLKNLDMIVLNKGTYECRRSVKIDGEPVQVPFVILKRGYYEFERNMDEEITESVKSEKYDLWGENPFGSPHAGLQNALLPEFFDYILKTKAEKNTCNTEGAAMKSGEIKRLIGISALGNKIYAVRPYTAWGALAGHAAWCTGFSYAYKLLCDSMGIGCAAIPANKESENPSHMWNAVKIDGYWYIVDIQASDLARETEYQYPTGGDFFFGSNNSYFLVSAERYMNQTGMKWDVENYPICNYDFLDE